MKVLQNFLNFLAKLLAIVWLLNFVVYITNATWSYIPYKIVVNIVDVIKNYGAFVIAGIVGFSVVVRCRWVFKILFLLLLVACIVLAIIYYVL